MSIGFRLCFQVVFNSKRGFGIFKCCFNWTSQLFPIYDKDGKLGFLKTSLDCASKFFQIHQGVGRLGFSKRSLYPPPIFKSFLLQKDALGTGLTNKQRIFQKKKYNSIHSVLLNFALAGEITYLNCSIFSSPKLD